MGNPINKDIVEIVKKTRLAEQDKTALLNSANHLIKREEYFNKLLIEDNEFNKNSLCESLKGLKVEKRKVDDLIELCNKKLNHYQQILSVLLEKVKN